MALNHEEINERILNFEHACREAGIKLTHQRKEVFREVAGTDEHPDAETIYRKVKVRIPEISLDTVYRTLWMLHDLDIVATLGPRRESVRFDANLEHHHHFFCIRCGLAKDFMSTRLDDLPLPEAVKEYGSIIAAHVEVRGICETCKQKDAGKPAITNPQPPQGQKRR